MNPKDPSNFHKMLIETPMQFEVGFELAKDVKVPGDFDKIVLSGMGGSALAGDLLQAYVNDLASRKARKSVGIFINRTYSLPPEAHYDAINIISSYSGNTEETISSFHEAFEKKLPCVAMSSGGVIEKISKEKNVQHIKLPMPFPDFQPRIGTGYFMGALIQILVNHEMISQEKKAIFEQIDRLKEATTHLERKGQELAKKLVGKTPVVYASAQFKSVAMVGKIKFNENAKTPAFWNFFPELNHNEMVGYTNPQGKFLTIMLKDPADNPKNLKRYEATTKLISEKGIEFEIIEMPDGDLFFKMFWSIMLMDFASYYLALEYNQDPTPVAMVESLKGILAK